MKAKDLLDSPEKWLQGSYARAADDRPCDWESDKAVRFCLVGAIKHVYRGA